METIHLFGYFNNKIIASGFLTPIYKDLRDNKIYFHELTTDNKKIKSLIKFLSLISKLNLFVFKVIFIM